MTYFIATNDYSKSSHFVNIHFDKFVLTPMVNDLLLRIYGFNN